MVENILELSKLVDKTISEIPNECDNETFNLLKTSLIYLRGVINDIKIKDLKKVSDSHKPSMDITDNERERFKKEYIAITAGYLAIKNGLDEESFSRLFEDNHVNSKPYPIIVLCDLVSDYVITYGFENITVIMGGDKETYLICNNDHVVCRYNIATGDIIECNDKICGISIKGEK